MQRGQRVDPVGEQDEDQAVAVDVGFAAKGGGIDRVQKVVEQRADGLQVGGRVGGSRGRVVEVYRRVRADIDHGPRDLHVVRASLVPVALRGKHVERALLAGTGGITALLTAARGGAGCDAASRAAERSMSRSRAWKARAAGLWRTETGGRRPAARAVAERAVAATVEAPVSWYGAEVPRAVTLPSVRPAK